MTEDSVTSTILVADDDLGHREALERILAKEGYAVLLAQHFLARHGQRAIAIPLGTPLEEAERRLIEETLRHTCEIGVGRGARATGDYGGMDRESDALHLRALDSPGTHLRRHGPGRPQRLPYRPAPVSPRRRRAGKRQEIVNAVEAVHF